MGSLKIYISDELEKRFKESAKRTYGYKEESIGMAAKNALEEWTYKVRKAKMTAEVPEDPVEAIWGMLSEVKKEGVELQHEAGKIRAKKLEHELSD